MFVPEFGNDAGKKVIIVRALYGLKSLGVAFHIHLTDCMEHMGYKSYLADPNLRYKPETDPKNGHEYYSYILCYVDDVLVIHHDVLPILARIDKYSKLKEASVDNPDVYLGAKLKKSKVKNGVTA